MAYDLGLDLMLQRSTFALEGLGLGAGPSDIILLGVAKVPTSRSKGQTARSLSFAGVLRS